MEFASCLVRLGGDIANEVPKSGVTPSEILLLKTIHGEGSVRQIEIQGSDRRPHAEERERLQRIYGGTPITLGDGTVGNAFTTVFPSPLTPMPVSFRDAGIETINGGVEELEEAEADKTAGKP